MLSKIDINKILPEFKKTDDINNVPETTNLDVNEFLAKMLGQNIEDINNLKDMSKSYTKLFCCILFTNNIIAVVYKMNSIYIYEVM